jgi:dipeptidyl aminopeptidase/acylaminoacyl peptidase
LVTAEKYKKRLSIIKVDNQNETFVCEAENIEDFVFTDDLSNFAFTEQDSNQNKTIQCCSLHKGRLIIVNSYKPTDSDSGFIIQSIDRFSNDGNKLFIRLQGKEIYKHLNDPVMVDIWSTKDDKLQSQQLNELGTNNYAAVLDLKTNAIKRLQLENEEISFIDDDLFTLRIQEGYTGERNWNKSARGQNYLASIKTGEKKLLSFRPLSVSPDSKFMICVDTNSMFVNLVSYNIATGETTQLTENLLPQMKSIGDYNIDDKRRMNFYGWLDIGHTLLFTDDFDFWKVDLDKPQHIINLTDGYGRRNQTILRPIIRNAKIRKDDIELFNAFDINTKKNGFLKFHKGGGANPVILTMSDCYYNIDLLSLPDYFPIKAKHANTWIVQKMTCDSPENYLITKDFKIFQALTDFHPQKDYNWMKSELINFTALDGRKLQGILYKPEDFDSTKKYAVIINFYEQLSHQLHIFHDPDYSIDNINIPYFVSHGYLVFTPDIYFEKGKALEDAYNSVIGSASYLSRLNFVDSMKIAIQGHSFGGSETNYIITKPNKFAAAMSAAGTINLISTAGSVSRNGTPYGREYAELAQGRIGYSLWECPDLYINNSPIFNVDKINLPVLLMYNKDDNAVNFAQGIEFFTALRRLGKTAWMLQYDGEGHSLIEKKNRMDYTNRLLQFFNHYLKGEPMPQWMESGIPAKFKGYTKGY